MTSGSIDNKWLRVTRHLLFRNYDPKDDGKTKTLSMQRYRFLLRKHSQSETVLFLRATFRWSDRLSEYLLWKSCGHYWPYLSLLLLKMIIANIISCNNPRVKFFSVQYKFSILCYQYWLCRLRRVEGFSIKIPSKRWKYKRFYL